MRTPNIKDADDFDSKYRRAATNNPLFDMLTNEFDAAMLERDMSDEDVLENLFVDNGSVDRLHKIIKGLSADNGVMKRSGAKGVDRGQVYLFRGRKGNGKTLTLKKLAQKIQSDAQNPDEMHILFLNMLYKKFASNFLKSLEGEDPIDVILNLLRDAILNDYSNLSLDSGSLSCYLNDLSLMRRLNGLYQHYDDARVAEHMDTYRIDAMRNLFRYLKEKRHKTYLIVDNIDDFPRGAIRGLIDVCIQLSLEYDLVCILALRNYWTNNLLGIDDKNIASLDLERPSILPIVMKRLEWIPAESITMEYAVEIENRSFILTAADMKDTLRTIINCLAQNGEIQNYIYKLSNYDIRENLFNIYNFMHSPYLYSKLIFHKALHEKVKEIYSEYAEEYENERGRPLLKFDVIECTMAIHSLCYDAASSKIFNIFFHDQPNDKDEYDYRSTLIYIRILQAIGNREKNKEQVVDRLSKVGYVDAVLRNAIDILLRFALIESKSGNREKDVTEIFVSAKGQIYLKELIYEYKYLVLICDAVPMPNQYKRDIIKKFGNDSIPINSGSLPLKDESVKKFAEFISLEERHEKNACDHRFKGDLDEIRGEYGISQIMKENIERTINKMKSKGTVRYRHNSKPSNISFRPIKGG